MDEGPSQTVPCYLILHSVSKRHNIGSLLRCCTAFRVERVCLVGSRHYNGFGSHGAANHVQLDYYATLEDCCRHLKNDRQCSIVGVEIMPEAKAVHEHPFCGPTAFMLGNEGAGLSSKQISLCDAFVYIAQYGAGTASLNVSTAAAIVLHHFALWAAYPEQGRDGQKFLVAEKGLKAHATGCVPMSPEERAAEQSRRAQLPTADWLMQVNASADAEEGLLVGLMESPG
ncbi:hypothetical protein WJX74_001110 [Apatococcus lobatus]|uniref:tRNA/rRNA methyltransferase SpoU type domain-containing protein n=2 Tax=Apatococcus TaxID=904362 RepID=A0AAW1T5A9_9CHLO